MKGNVDYKIKGFKGMTDEWSLMFQFTHGSF